MKNYHSTQQKRSERSLYTSRSDSSQYKPQKKPNTKKLSPNQSNTPIHHSVSPYQEHISFNAKVSMRGLNTRPTKLMNIGNTAKVIKTPALPRPLPSKSMNTSPIKQKQINTKITKANNRYQPKGLVKKVNTKRQYKSIQHIKDQSLPLASQRRKQHSILQALDTSIDGNLRPSGRIMNINPHPVIDNQLLIKSKLQKSYVNLLAIYEQASKRLMESQFKINLLSNIDQISRKCQQYFKRIINNRSVDFNILQGAQQTIKAHFNSYVPIWKLFKLDSFLKQNAISLKKYKNSIYFGNLKDGKKHGLGIMIYQNDKIFQGNFQNDLRIYGMQKNGSSIYIGPFNNGLKQGENGILKNGNEIQYGKFQLDQWVGEGFSLTDDKFICTDNNSISILKTRQDNIFIGKYTQNMKSQICLQKFSDGDIYLGTYEDNKPEGYGEYYWVNGGVYLGDFVYGLRHGNGYWFIQGGDQYIGEYSNDKKCGKGEYIWKNQTKYVGAFQNDFRHGYGQMYWNTGKVYKGNWVNGLQQNKKLSFLGNQQIDQSWSKEKGLPELKTKAAMGIGKGRLNHSIEMRRGSNTIDIKGLLGSTNSKNLSQRIIRKDRLKAIFNPNSYLDG